MTKAHKHKDLIIAWQMGKLFSSGVVTSTVG